MITPNYNYHNTDIQYIRESGSTLYVGLAQGRPYNTYKTKAEFSPD